MRMITAFCWMLICSVSFSQANITSDSGGVFLRGAMGCGVMRCQADNFIDSSKKSVPVISSADSEPLLVIDGFPYPMKKLKEIDANNIATIDILKGEEFLKFSCRSSRRGFIIITTKNSSNRRFIIRDALTGERIAGATASFISQTDKEIFSVKADEQGIVEADQALIKERQGVCISSAGYKTAFIDIDTIGAQEDVLLERDIISLQGVTVTSNSIICDRIGITNIVTHVSNCEMAVQNDYNVVYDKLYSGTLNLYPNPAQRGSSVTINIKSELKGLFNKYKM